MLLCIAVFVIVWYPSTASAESVEYPSDAGIINVKNFGAKGNGVTDDTAAIQRSIDQTYRYNGGDPNNFRILYFPDGIYKVSDQISWKRWVTIQGQSKANTVIKLRDRAPGYGVGHTKPVLHCHYSNNESFNNSIHNLTIDTGIKNPGAVGIRYNNHNAGTVSNLMIRSGDGTGSVGLDLTEDEFGPGLIKDVTVEGFDKGVVTVGSVSHATFVNLSLKHQNVVGFENS
ncbi:MAG: hypothetical protein JO235_25485, partial [Chroococcidiopsidaceae cyanobacterium CP_BM_RX_35]|nr:hypothetical protein [Chroococcidiopsidaceae cyanobacterium CP_BM_RX_35]